VDASGIEITHEALLQAWPRLRTWVDEDRVGLVTRRQLTVAANDWARSGRDPSTLYRGGRLSAAREWAEQMTAVHPEEINAFEDEFLSASAAAEAQEAATLRLRTRRLRQLVAGLLVLLLLAGALSGVTWRLRDQATHERDLALSRQVAAASDRVRSTDVALSAQLAVSAYRLAPTLEATSAVLDSSTSPIPTRLIGPAGVMQALVTTADERLLAATGSIGVIRLWSIAGSVNPRRITDLTVKGGSTLFTLAFSPDGRTLAAAGADRSVHLYDVADPRHPTELSPPLSGPAGTVYALSFSPDGRVLVAGSKDGAVHRWDMTSTPPRPMSSLTGHFGAVHAVAFAPGVPPGGSVLAAGTDDGMVHIWDGATASDPQPLAARPAGSSGPVYGVAFSPDGRRLAAGSQDGEVYGWDATGAKSSISWIKPSPWPKPLRGPTSWVNGVAFLPDNRTLVAASSDNHEWSWDVVSGAAAPALPHPGPVAAITVLDGGHVVATADADGLARLWPQPSRLATHDPGTPYELTYSDDGSLLAAGSTGNQVTLWDVRNSMRPWLRGVPVTGPSSPVAALIGSATISQNGQLLAAGTKDGQVQLWSLDAGRDPVELPETLSVGTKTVEWLAFSPDGRTLAAGGDDNTISLWDLADPDSPSRMGTTLKADNYVYAIAFSPRGDRLAVGTAGGTVWVWNVSDRSRPEPIAVPLRATPSYVFSVAFSPDGSMLAAATGSKDVVVWRLQPATAAPVLLTRIGGPTNNANAVTFSPDGRQLAAGSEDGSVWLYDMTRAEKPPATATLQAAGGRVIALAYSPDGRTLSAGAPGAVRMWTTDADAVADSICAGRGDALTSAEWALYLPGTPYRDACHPR
jgi:WD40 repeat protein